jgi:FkbM family methyltransferase
MIDVSRYPGSQTIVGRLMRAPLRLVPVQTVVPILQGPVRWKRWIVGSGIHRLWLGSYEPFKMKLAATCIARGDTVFDVGANVGIYTLLFSDLVGPEGRVVAFEPAPRNTTYLRRHLALNKARNVEVMETAVSSCVGVSSFDVSDDSSTGRLDQHGSLKVETTTIDAVVESSGLAPSLLKIDVEGGELGVLIGSKATLAKLRPRLLVATHSPDLKQACVEFLARHSYSVNELHDGRGALSDELFAVPSDQTPCANRR